jgi:hypothetical protein
MTGAMFRDGARSHFALRNCARVQDHAQSPTRSAPVVCFGNPDDCIPSIRGQPAFALDLHDPASSTRSTREKFRAPEEYGASKEAAWTLRREPNRILSSFEGRGRMLGSLSLFLLVVHLPYPSLSSHWLRPSHESMSCHHRRNRWTFRDMLSGSALLHSVRCRAQWRRKRIFPPFRGLGYSKASPVKRFSHLQGKAFRFGNR